MSDNDAQNTLHGVDIGKILSSKGPIVQCVLLKAGSEQDDAKKPAENERIVLANLIDQVAVDTTPSQQGVAKALGGPFTFVGQYPDEGTVVMATRLGTVDIANGSLRQLKSHCAEAGIDTSKMLEKQDLVTALKKAQGPLNTHPLQPPLDDLVVHGDLLLMRVAETNEEQAEVMPSEEFFLDYTRDEYLTFAARTDVVAPEAPVEEEEEEDYQEGEDGDEDYNLADDDDVEDDEEGMQAAAAMNLILGEVIKEFRERNGRGPDTQELLELRSQVASKLGMETKTLEEIEKEEASKKREASTEATSDTPNKRVKFTAEHKSPESVIESPLAAADDTNETVQEAEASS